MIKECRGGSGIGWRKRGKEAGGREENGRLTLYR